MAERIRLSRARGWRKPEGAVVVSRPSKWGNPFVVGEYLSVSGIDADGLRFEARIVATPAVAVAMYRDLMDGRLTVYDVHEPEDVAYVAKWTAALEDLRGVDLACWCPTDQPCHADVLLALANGVRP